MISLIITLVSIALVAIISVVVIYNGGMEFMSGSDKAAYAQLINESGQIRGALEIYAVENMGNSPASVQDLIDGGYLKTSAAKNMNISSGDEDWIFKFDNLVSRHVSEAEQCAAINLSSGGSGEVADIPSCSDAHSETSPCCVN